MNTKADLIALYEARVAALVAEGEGIVNDPAALRAHNQRIRAARLSLARAKGTHTRSQWLALVEECDGKCVRCGRQHDVAGGELPCKGYRVQLWDGGSNAIENLMPVCKSCASARQSGEPDWLDRFRELRAASEPTPAEGA